MVIKLKGQTKKGKKSNKDTIRLKDLAIEKTKAND